MYGVEEGRGSPQLLGQLGFGGRIRNSGQGRDWGHTQPLPLTWGRSLTLGRSLAVSEVVLIFHTSPLPSAHPRSLTRPSASPSPGAPGRASLYPSAQSSPSGLPSLHPHLAQFLAFMISASPVAHGPPELCPDPSLSIDWKIPFISRHGHPYIP